jgi:CDP-paratose 2-epimerase
MKDYNNIIITGGCGFVGSSIALYLRKTKPDSTITAIDNLSRKGSELNVERLTKAGITVTKADVRKAETFASLSADLIIDCAAEPSVLAGTSESNPALYALETNILGTVHCLELARTTGADFLFLSTSRVYPLNELNSIATVETQTRFDLLDTQPFSGVSGRGINESFPLGEERTLYGTTKLSSEMITREYGLLYGVKYIINRCGVIAGPWQFGKVDQGIATLWMARHYFNNAPLSYIGFGGEGKQVRDFIHCDDLCEALDYQFNHFDTLSGTTFNIGGGVDRSVSLLELTALCQKISGNSITINKIPETRWGDVKLYISDATKFEEMSGWKPKRNVENILKDIHTWLNVHEKAVGPLFNS